MFADMTPEEQTRMAKAYMAQSGAQMTNANLSQAMNLLATNPGMEAFIGNQLNKNDPTMRDDARGNINAMVEASMVDNPGTNAVAPVSTRQPPKRPASVAPANGGFKEGGDPVSLAGGTLEPKLPASNPAQPDVATAGNPSSLPEIIKMVLLGGAAAAGGKYFYDQSGKTLPPKQYPQHPDKGASDFATPPNETDGMKRNQVVPYDAASAPKQMPPEAGGPVVPKRSAQQQLMLENFGEDVVDAEYKEVPPKAVGETKKLTGPKEVDDRDNVKKADGEVIEGKADASTAKEKLKKPKVRVR